MNKTPLFEGEEDTVCNAGEIVRSYWVYNMHDITLLLWVSDIMDHTTTTRRLIRKAT